MIFVCMKDPYYVTAALNGFYDELKEVLVGYKRARRYGAPL